MSNYPEDIRQYDNDPRSPFYDDRGTEWLMEERYIELIKELEMNIEREAQYLADALDDGEISIDEYEDQMYELEAAYREAAQEAAQEAYDREMDRW